MREDINRDNSLIAKSFVAIVIPLVLRSIAFKVIDLVDAILVGHFLGASDLVAIEIGAIMDPIADLPIAVFGTGGAILVGNLLGKGTRKRANQVFSFCIFCSVLFSALIALLSFVCGPLARLLSGGVDPEIAEAARRYMVVNFVTSPVVVGLSCLSVFITTEGYAKIVSAYCISTNILNALFDIVFLKFYSFGIESVIWASVIGYILSSVILLPYFRVPERMLAFVGPFKGGIKTVKKLLRAGLPICFRVTLSTVSLGLIFSLVSSMFGMAGLMLRTLYTEMSIIVGLFIEGILSAFTVHTSILNGGKDYFSLRNLVKKNLLLVLALTFAVIVLFEVFPSLFFRIYGVSDMQDAVAPLLRLCMPILIIDAFILFWAVYYEAIVKTSFAMFVDIFNIHAIQLAALLVVKLIMVSKSAYIFPVCIIIEGVLSLLLVIAYHSKNHTLRNWALLPVVESDVIYMTVDATENFASLISRRIEEFCGKHGVEHKLSTLVALAAEEMVCIQMSHKQDKNGCIDITMRIDKDNMLLTIRDKGKPFDILGYAESEASPGSSVNVIKKIATKISYTRVVQMNNTIIEVGLH